MSLTPTRALAALGKTAKEAAARLREFGVRGRRYDSTACVLRVYLATYCGDALPEGFAVERTHVFRQPVRAGGRAGGGVVLELPRHLTDLVDAVDQGRHPELLDVPKKAEPKGG